MRIYNNTNSQIEFELTPARKVVIPAHSYSGDFLPTTAAIDKLVRAFTPDQLAFLAGNAAELNLCSTTQCTTTGNFVVGSFDEVAERFKLNTVKKETTKKKVVPATKTPEVKEEVEGAVLKEKVIEAAPETVKEPVKEDTPVSETEPEQESSKKSKRKKKE